MLVPKRHVPDTKVCPAADTQAGGKVGSRRLMASWPDAGTAPHRSLLHQALSHAAAAAADDDDDVDGD